MFTSACTCVCINFKCPLHLQYLFAWNVTNDKYPYSILFYAIKASEIGKNLETVGNKYWQDIFKNSVIIKKISMKKKVILGMPK